MFDTRSVGDGYRGDSLAGRLRARRFELFEGLAQRFVGPLRVLDIGGTVEFWWGTGWMGRPDVSITCVNIDAKTTEVENIRVECADATDLSSYDDATFDIAFSNSVIEHLFTREAQRAMASEVRRVARAHWVQTPSFWFPIEPHFHMPGWHWLPVSVRASLLQRRSFGWRGPCPDPARARTAVEEVRLMTSRELRADFPDSHIWRETWMGLTKSLVAYGGFGCTIEGASPETHETLAHAA